MPAPTPEPAATLRPLRVDVAGAVANPRVYTLAPGSIVEDAIDAAGGPAAEADMDRVNKAIGLQDGMQVYVPRRAQEAAIPPVSTPPVMEAAPRRPCVPGQRWPFWGAST